MGDKTVNTWLAGCARGLALRLILSVLAFGLLGVVIVGAALLDFLGIAQGWMVFAAGLIALVGLMLAGTLAWAIWVLARRRRQWDAIFTPLGLAGGTYMLTGRQYTGSLGGREVAVRLYRGPTFIVVVNTPLHTRMAIGTQTALGSAAGSALGAHTLPLDAAYAGRVASAHDELWAHRLLDDPDAREAILWLTQDETSFDIRTVMVQPGGVVLQVARLPLNTLSVDSARRWLDDLLTVAHTAERLPAPSEQVEETGLERSVRSGQTGRTAVIIAIGAVILAVLAGCAVVAVALGILLARAG
jgi:hypothetical protein